MAIERLSVSSRSASAIEVYHGSNRLRRWRQICAVSLAVAVRQFTMAATHSDTMVKLLMRKHRNNA